LLQAGFTSHWNVTIPGGELLPHPFTLTLHNKGGLVSAALSIGLLLPGVTRCFPL